MIDISKGKVDKFTSNVNPNIKKMIREIAIKSNELTKIQDKEGDSNNERTGRKHQENK